MLATSSSPLVTEAPFVASTVKTLFPSVLSTFSLILPSVVFSMPSEASILVSATSIVTVCLPVEVSVFADTVALPVPLNSTSSAFLTAVWNAVSVVPVPFVVLSAESTQPSLRKSPTVAAVVSATDVPVPPPFAGVVAVSKLIKPFLAVLVLAAGCPFWVSP